MKLWPFSKNTAPVDETKGAVFPATVFHGLGQAAFMQRNPRAFSEEGYTKNVIAFRCIQKIATAASMIDLKVRERKGDKIVDLPPDHLLAKLLKRPNPTIGGASFFEALVSFQLIAGNAYIMRSPDDLDSVKPPRELWLLAPERTQVIAGGQGMPLAYTYEMGSGNKKRYDVDQITGKSAVLHLADFNPTSDWYGLSPMEAAAYSIDTMNSALKWNKALLDNSGRPSGAFTVTNKDGTAGKLSEEQIMRMREQIDKMMTGAAAAGRPYLLEGGMEWKEMAMAPKDMDFSNNLMTAARFTAVAYGVPPQLVNIPGESTYSNYEQAIESFYTDTVLPRLDKTIDELNHWLSPLYGDDVFIGYDAEAIPAFENKRASKFERIDKSTMLTTNEKRRELGYPEVDGGDVLFVPNGQVPLELMTAGGIDDPKPSK